MVGRQGTEMCLPSGSCRGAILWLGPGYAVPALMCACLLVILFRVADDFESFDGEDEEDELIVDAVRYCICSRPKWIAPMVVCKSKQRICNGYGISCVKYSV